MAYTHGHNYSYTSSSNNEVVLFPVAWDLGTTFSLMRNYYIHYMGYDLNHSTSMAMNIIEGILAEAYQHGVNTLIVRSEAEMMTPDAVRTFELADLARDAGMNVIIGGMKNDGGLVSSQGHNQTVMNTIWLEYYDQCLRNSSQGDFIGVFGFVEPDNEIYEYYPEVSSVALFLGGVGGFPGFSGMDLPFGSKLCQVSAEAYDQMNPDEIRNLTSMILDPINNWRSTPFVYGHALDYIAMNYYPCRARAALISAAYPENVLDEATWIVARGAADLAPSLGSFRDAYCDRDEYFALTSAGNLRVYRLEGGEGTSDLSFSFLGQTAVGVDPLDEGFRMTSSDTRSSDVGSRTGSPVLNGSVVFWLENEPVSEARAVFWHESGIVSRPLPSVPGYDSKQVCVGELDYRSGWNSSTQCTGVIGSDEMRTLWVGKPQPPSPVNAPWQVKVFRRNASGNLGECPTSGTGNSIQLPAGFHPDGAVWGYFWRQSADEPHFRSGFVLYTNEGQYMVVYSPVSSSENWTLTTSTPYEDLWGANMVAGPVTVFRDNRNWPYTLMGRTHDRLIALVSPENPSSQETWVVWSSVGSGPGSVSCAGSKQVKEISLLSRAEDLSDLSVYNAMSSKVVLLVNDNDIPLPPSIGRRTRWSLEQSFPFQSDVEFEMPNWSNSWIVLSPMRSRHCRIPESDVIIDKENGLYIWGGTADLTHSSDCMNNMFSNAAASPQDMGALDIMLEYGINQATKGECLMLTVQCHGRGCFGSGQFFPGDGVMGYDELMYIMGAALVHGIRGYYLYSLDKSLFGGPSNPLSPVNRFPPEMLFWGASVDGPNDVDMVARTHEAVQAFTCVDEGNNTTFDLLESLVNPSYQALENGEAYNAYMNAQHQTIAEPYPEEPYFNFLALREPDDDILVLISNDGDGGIVGDCIVFPDSPESDYINYGTPEVLIGNVSSLLGFHGLKYSPPGYYLMFLDGFDNQEFALIRIPASGNDNRGMNTSTIIEQPRLLTVSRNTGSSVLVEAQGAEVQIFDLTGRVVERIARGETIEFSSCIHPAGVYFAVLSEEDTPLFIEKLVLLNGGR